MGAQGVPQGMPQGAPQRAPQMPSIPFADSSAASSSSAQQAGQPFQSAEMLSASEPISMDGVFQHPQVGATWFMCLLQLILLYT